MGDDPRPTEKMEYKCIYCNSEKDVSLYIVEYVEGSVGVIRPICRKCIEEREEEEV